MSKSIVQPLDYFAINEPRLELDNKRVYVIEKGGQTVTYTPYPATSFNNTGFVFNTTPPSKGTVLDRIAIIKVPVSLTFTGTAPGTDTILQKGRDAFRAYPLSSVTSTLTSIINGFPVSVELKDVVHIMSRFHEKIDNRNTFASITPQMEDNYQQYSDANGAGNNPLNDYTGNGGEEIPRGAFPYIDPSSGLVTATTNSGTSALINATITEYVMLPPYLWDGSEAGGLCHLDTLVFRWILDSNLAHMWSHSSSSTATITNINVQFGQPTMLLGWITPRLQNDIPALITYPYFQISKYVTQRQLVLNSLTSTTLQSNVIQLQSIPRKIYIFAKRSDTDVFANLNNMITATDTYLKISKVNISWDNIDGILSGAAPEDLFIFSQNNGLNLSYPEWSGQTQQFSGINTSATKIIGTVGGIVCIEPGKDFGLRDNQAVGINGNFNFQVKLDVTNVSTLNYNVDLFVLAVYDGVMHITGNSCNAEIGVISHADVLNAPIRHDISHKMLEKVYGGANFFSRFKDVAGKALNFLKENKVLSKGLSAIPHPAAQIGSTVASAFGYGGCQDCQGECNCGGARAGTLFGGEGAKRNMMYKRLMRM